MKRIGLYVGEDRWLWLKQLSLQRAGQGLVGSGKSGSEFPEPTAAGHDNLPEDVSWRREQKETGERSEAMRSHGNPPETARGVLTTTIDGDARTDRARLCEQFGDPRSRAPGPRVVGEAEDHANVTVDLEALQS